MYVCSKASLATTAERSINANGFPQSTSSPIVMAGSGNEDCKYFWLPGTSLQFFARALAADSCYEESYMKTIQNAAAALALAAACALGAYADAPPASKDGLYFPSATKQTETDEYTRYELLAPQTASFKIYYEVTATTAGAKVFYNPIRKGSVASDESVYDAMSGKPLPFEVVSGTEAHKDALMADADLDTDYIKVTLARPVPEHGQGRVVIVITYKDAKNYYLDGKMIVFNRPLGIKRNKVVLPAGFEVVGLTVPSQILIQKDGRIAISFMHAGTGEAPLVLKAIKDAQTGAPALP